MLLIISSGQAGSFLNAFVLRTSLNAAFKAEVRQAQLSGKVVKPRDSWDR